MKIIFKYTWEDQRGRQQDKPISLDKFKQKQKEFSQSMFNHKRITLELDDILKISPNI